MRGKERKEKEKDKEKGNKIKGDRLTDWNKATPREKGPQQPIQLPRMEMRVSLFKMQSLSLRKRDVEILANEGGGVTNYGDYLGCRRASLPLPNHYLVLVNKSEFFPLHSKKFAITSNASTP